MGTKNLISSSTAEKLRSSYQAKTFDWRRLAQYSFWIAMACGVIALGSLLIDKEILNFIEKIYATPNAIISLLSALVATWLYPAGIIILWD